MRPKGTKQELEARRRRAVGMLGEGQGVREVALQVGVHAGSVSRWKKMVETNGPAGLKAKPGPGSVSRLTASQKERLRTLLTQGPAAHGYKTALWTLKRVAEVIERHFGVSYHPGHVWRILRALGWSCQKPERRARERDEKAVERWCRVAWPRIKKSPKRGP
ncbi:MAG: IS630 family transposase [Candidatus Eisenbacteria sp.]|nr:IS630 family transposase [Candidatus Eisenbacteria bacterium]